MAKIRNKKTGKEIEVNEDDLHIYGLGRKKLPKALLGKKQHGDLEAIYNQGNQSFNEDTTDPFSQMDYSDLPMLQPNIGFQGLINEKNNGFPLSDSPYSTLKRPQEQTYQMDKLPTQLIPEQQAPQFKPLSEDTQNQQNKFNWQNGIDAASIANQGLRQFQMGTKGFINNIINNSLTNRDNFRKATQFGQLAYADAENRPQGQIYGKDIRGGNALFANGGINLKELYTPETNKANIEVEKNEFISIPHMDNGGHSGLSEKVNFGGSHGEITNGSSGTPMNLPANTLVFSVQNKVKKTPLLAPLLEDGLLKVGDIGKPWSSVANKFKTVDDVNRKENKFSDSIQKTTADMLINMKQAKLKRLFEEGQEPEKLYGFQGKKAQFEAVQSLQQEQHPEQEQPIAKYGMKLPKFDVGGVNYAALSNVEKQLGVLKNGMPSSTGYDDKSIHQLDSKMVERIKGTIGEDTWNKLPDNLKTQVFSFAFNNGVEKKNWLTGLAQAIDPAIKDRTTLSETDAISIIKNNIGKIDNNVYNNYINKVLPSQYNSIASSNNKQEENKKLWQFRPDNINQFLQNSNNQTPTTQPSVSPTFTGLNPTINQSNARNVAGDLTASENYLPFKKSELPDGYGSSEQRAADIIDFNTRFGLSVDPTDPNAIGKLRAFQIGTNPGLVKHYKENFARGNNAAYALFQGSKGYKKNPNEKEESKNFFNWSRNNNKQGQDYTDNSLFGHEYFNKQHLDQTAKDFFKGNEGQAGWGSIKDIDGKTYYYDKGAYDPADINNPKANAELNPVTYYDFNEEQPAAKEPTKSDVVDKTQYKIPERKQDKSFNIPNLNFGIPLPYNEKTTPLNYYKVQPEFIDPRYLNVQPQLNDITRGVRTVQNNLGDRSTASVGNSLQAQINAYGQENQVYGNKYNYDKGQDSQAQQFNAQAKMTTDQYNQNSWYNQLEDPIRARSSAKNKQFKENQQRGLENWNEQMAFNNNSNYINDTFYNPKNINDINWGANLNPVDIKKAKESKWNDEIEKEQYIKQKKAELGIGKNGGKVRIKPKIKLK